MKAYIQKIDITTDGEVVVSGHLASTNLQARLSEHVYIREPDHGIYGYTLEVLPTSLVGAQMLVPFVVKAPWTGSASSNGLRIIQPAASAEGHDHETLLLKVSKTDKFTEEQANYTIIRAAEYHRETRQLIVDVQYGGGCFPHNFALEWDGSSLESFPPQYNFTLVDLSPYDPCKAIINTQLRFDIETPEVQLDVPSVINLETLSGRQLRIKIE